MSGEGSGSAQGTENEKEEEEKVEEEKVLGRRPWTREEDDKLLQMVRVHGPRNWKVISSEIPGRSDRMCRQRWTRNLSLPCRKRLYRWFTAEEDDVIVRAQPEHGSDWATIAQLLESRSERDVKNRWHSILRLRKSPAEGSQQQQQLETFVGASASSSCNSEIDFFERKRLCQREEEDVETPDTERMNLLEPDPITTLSLSLPGQGGDGGGSLKGKEKKE